LSEKGTQKFTSHQLWPPISPDLNPVDYNITCGNIARKGA